MILDVTVRYDWIKTNSNLKPSPMKCIPIVRYRLGENKHISHCPLTYFLDCNPKVQYYYFRFIVGNFLLSWMSIIGWFAFPRVFPLRSVINSDLMTLSANSWLPNWYKVGFSFAPPLLLCLAKCSSKGSCENFSLNTIFTPGSCKSNFVNSTKDFTKSNKKVNFS